MNKNDISDKEFKDILKKIDIIKNANFQKKEIYFEDKIYSFTIPSKLILQVGYTNKERLVAEIKNISIVNGDNSDLHSAEKIFCIKIKNVLTIL